MLLIGRAGLQNRLCPACDQVVEPPVSLGENNLCNSEDCFLVFTIQHLFSRLRCCRYGQDGTSDAAVLLLCGPPRVRTLRLGQSLTLAIQ